MGERRREREERERGREIFDLLLLFSLFSVHAALSLSLSVKCLVQYLAKT